MDTVGVTGTDEVIAGIESGSLLPQDLTVVEPEPGIFDSN
ncbi:MAG: hypothetical protein FD153_923 [Rhodospirillaceae bacterium]|nr:MAG: hypothetical protein FD153_923 [Rhodospirillaceae bacterium]